MAYYVMSQLHNSAHSTISALARTTPLIEDATLQIHEDFYMSIDIYHLFVINKV